MVLTRVTVELGPSDAMASRLAGMQRESRQRVHATQSLGHRFTAPSKARPPRIQPRREGRNLA